MTARAGAGPDRYSLAAIALHWAIAALLAFEIGLGWQLDELGQQGAAMYQLHKSIGIGVLLITLVRIVVRCWKPRPPKLEGGWRGALASLTHGGLYAFMIGAPLTGWAYSSTSVPGYPTSLFGLVALPRLPLPAAGHEALGQVHGTLALIAIALLALHVAGALRHHLLLRDGILWRMMPVRRRVMLVALPALIPLGLVVAQLILPDVPAAGADR